MIEVTFDANKEMAKIEKKLGDLSGKAPKVMATAVNQTAKQARKMLAKQAQEVYAVKQGGFTKAMKMKSATQATPEATISAGGENITLYKFKTSPASVKTGADKPDVVKAKVIKANALKSLIWGSNKAFLAKMSGGNGHIGVFERLTENRLPIRELGAVSIPGMLGSEKNYGHLKPEIYKILQEQIDTQIKRTLGGYLK